MIYNDSEILIKKHTYGISFVHDANMGGIRLKLYIKFEYALKENLFISYLYSLKQFL